MIHFDQPALLGSVLLIYCIARYKINNSKKLLYIGTIVSVSLGRGYANYSILGLWFLIEAFFIIKDRSNINKDTITDIYKHISLKTLILGMAVGSTCLFYNIYMESKKTNVPIAQVDIIHTAKKRLSLQKQFNVSHKNRLQASVFIKQQLSRITDLLIPVKSSNFFKREVSF